MNDRMLSLFLLLLLLSLTLRPWDPLGPILAPRVTLTEVTSSLFISKIQPTGYIRIANPSGGGGGGETTRVSELSRLGR